MRGILIINKEVGMTSFDVVSKLRRILKTKKIGHTGTLDPEATGVLPVCIGSATKAVEMLKYHTKEYIAGIRFGLVTDTQDIHGTVLKEQESHVTREMLQQMLPTFTGVIEQLTPMYSARKVNGHKLCDLARKGITVERATVPVTIHELELLNFDEEKQEAVLRVDCSGGTYIRTLCNDLGEMLGCGACMTTLKRTRVGDFLLSESLTLGEVAAFVEKGTLPIHMMDTDRLFSDKKRVNVVERAEKYLLNGNTLTFDEVVLLDGETIPGEQVRVYFRHLFFGVFTHTADGYKPYRMFFPEPDEVSVGRAVMIGKFDGLHKGHQSLLESMKETHPELCKTLVTFDFNRAKEEFRKNQVLFTQCERTYLAESLGFDEIVTYPFTDELRNMSPEAFLEKLLREELQTKALYAGENFRFGYERRGDAAFLREHGAEYGIECHVLPEVCSEDKVISSTVLREEMSENDLLAIRKRMGFPFFLRGTVEYGKQLGRTIGIPTVNLNLSTMKMLPERGVYASITVYRGKLYYGMTNIGLNPTVSDERVLKAETHLFDFHGDCYKESISVFLLAHTRKEQTFSGMEELLSRLKADEKEIKEHIEYGKYEAFTKEITDVFGLDTAFDYF